MGILTNTVTNAQGYEFVEATDFLASLCLPLPCWSGLRWDGYLTTVREVHLGGEKVVIQAWKGTCARFALLPDTPGGIGGEVGIYRQVADCPVPREVPPDLQASPRFELPAEPCDLWWPHPAARAKLSFELLHPKTGAPFFHVGSDRTQGDFWLSHLMTFESYQRYESERPDCPAPHLFKMHVHVGDYSFIW
ncbi:MAG: hypothetical protein U0441_07525 [Polyangiaceae bacterium]